jgi:hypothetical protein
MKGKLLFAVLAVALPFSCMKNPSGLPDPMGYDGFIAAGWQSLAQGRPSDALGWFQQAMALDVSRADGYLGAGVSSIYLEDCWPSADSYFQAAIQQDFGRSAVLEHLSQNRTQDTLWTVFQCVDSDLPQDSLQLWLALTADSGSVWVGGKIHDYLVSRELDTDLLYRFIPGNEEPAACLELFNMQSGESYLADSVRGGFVYFTAPVSVVSQGLGVQYYTWVMADQAVVYDYATFTAETGAGQITRDALAAWTMLQEVRGADGNLLLSAACARGLLWADPDYRFGAGDSIRGAVFQTDIDDVVSTCASHAFTEGLFIYSWFLCREAGYGLGLDPFSPGFLLELLQVIQSMQGPQ